MKNVWLLILGASGCVPAQRGACDDSQKLPCFTDRVCHWDDKRGCEVCVCAAPPYVPPERTPPK